MSSTLFLVILGVWFRLSFALSSDNLLSCISIWIFLEWICIRPAHVAIWSERIRRFFFFWNVNYLHFVQRNLVNPQKMS